MEQLFYGFLLWVEEQRGHVVIVTIRAEVRAHGVVWRHWWRRIGYVRQDLERKQKYVWNQTVNIIASSQVQLSLLWYSEHDHFSVFA